MSRLAKQVAMFAVGFVAFFGVLGIAGTHDRASEIVYNMPDAIYEQVKLELGDDVSEVEIADYYIKHQAELEQQYGNK
jgi:hypothetical protein